MPPEAATLKSLHPLRPFLERAAGLKFIAAGPGLWRSRCPFQEERTGSFYVYEKDQHYHCYGCGAHGDLFDYLEATEGLDFKAARDRLTGHTSPALTVRNPHRPAPSPRPLTTEPEPALHLMSERERDTWAFSCERLLRPEHLDRWAGWRGLSPDLLANCARAGLLGVHSWRGQMREAFLIHAPTTAYASDSSLSPQSSSFHPHAIHVRLAPGSVGNDHANASWRYDPPSGLHTRTVSFPFILAQTMPFSHEMQKKFHMEPAKPWSWLLFTEGQWDALALADALGWHSLADIPAHTAIIGLRGATSWRRFIEFCLSDSSSFIPHPSSLRPIAVCFADADRAGAQWYAPEGFLSQLRPLCRDVICYRPTAPGCKDLNDLWKRGQLDTAKLRALLRHRLSPSPCLPVSASSATRGTFLAHLRALRRQRPDLQPAIAHVLADPHKPLSARAPVIWQSYLRDRAPDLLEHWRSWLAA